MSAPRPLPPVGHVLVIGASGGVGAVVARQLSEAGATVIATCRTAAQSRQLLSSGICRHALRMTLDRSRSITGAFQALARLGVHALAGIVNCAALTQPRPLELSPMAEVRRTFEVNLFGALEVIQHGIPLLRAARGRIVLVSSTSGSLGVPLLGAYSASKFALEGIADVLRRELSPWNIGVSLVVPGGIKTPMIERQIADIDAALAQLRPGIEADYAVQYRQHRWVIEVAGRTAVTPEVVAAQVLRALTDRHPKARYACGLPSVAARVLSKTLPDAALDWMFDAVPSGESPSP